MIRNTVTYTVNGHVNVTVLDRDRDLTRNGAERILNAQRKAEGREPVIVERVESMPYSRQPAAPEKETKIWKDPFTAEEQAEFDRELCRTCGLRFDEHDGREEHRFQGR